MFALYNATGADLVGRKREWLARFQQDGFWLLDVVDRPVNKLSSNKRAGTKGGRTSRHRTNSCSATQAWNDRVPWSLPL